MRACYYDETGISSFGPFLQDRDITAETCLLQILSNLLCLRNGIYFQIWRDRGRATCVLADFKM